MKKVRIVLCLVIRNVAELASVPHKTDTTVACPLLPSTPGAEKCLLHGDNESEKLLSEIVGAAAYGMCQDCWSAFPKTCSSLFLTHFLPHFSR